MSPYKSKIVKEGHFLKWTYQMLFHTNIKVNKWAMAGIWYLFSNWNWNAGNVILLLLHCKILCELWLPFARTRFKSNKGSRWSRQIFETCCLFNFCRYCNTFTFIWDRINYFSTYLSKHSGIKECIILIHVIDMNDIP